MNLALFPLHTVLFPHEQLPLHVFEPRYRRMVADVAGAAGQFGVVAIRAGTEVGPRSEVHVTGTVAEIEQLAELDDGRFGLVCRGLRRFHIVERFEDDPYPNAGIELLDDARPGTGLWTARTSARAALRRYLAELRRRGAELPEPVESDGPTESFTLPATAPLDVSIRQRILEADTAADRLRVFAEHASREAKLLATIGPSAGIPKTRPSPN